MRGLEPPRREALDPKSSVYTNFTTSAKYKEKKGSCKDSYVIFTRANINGTPSTIRTCDRTLRRRVLYPAELWKHVYQFMVRMRGLEPPRREALDPKSSVYTNFTTSA